MAVLALRAGAVAEQVSQARWASDCQTDYCVFRKPIDQADVEGTFALFEILIDTYSGEASLVLTVPLGIALQPGVQINVEDQKWQAPVKVCYGDGCRATVKISPDDLAFLLQKEALYLRYIPFGKENPVEATVSLSGLVAAISRSR